MNEPSLVRFEGWVKPGGTIIVNSSLVKRTVGRSDIKSVYVPANDIAEKLGSDKIANMVLLGSYLAVSKAIPPEAVLNTMKQKLSGKPALVPFNEAAIKSGLNLTEGSH